MGELFICQMPDLLLIEFTDATSNNASLIAMYALPYDHITPILNSNKAVEP